jgi:tartrate-resistant acid phosphatase type 5
MQVLSLICLNKQKVMMTKRIILFTYATVCYCGVFAQNKYREEIESGYRGGIINGIKTLKNSINFCVIGDWGRHGMYYQKEVAQKLGDASVGLDADFIISTGDNFYPNGVESVNDPSWKSSFENIYTHHGTFTEWYVALGNHDYRSNPDAQVAYSSISQRWHMPSRYFSIKKMLDDDSTKTVELFFIDSNPFQSDYYSDDIYAPKVKQADTAAQKKWLEEALGQSKALWKIVVGHHPLYSAGKRKGKTGDMINSFQPLFNKYKVDAYFAGHEHHLEYDKTATMNFHHFISGAGSEARPVGTAIYTKAAFAAHGFLAVSINEKEMLVQFIDHNGRTIYSTIIRK